MIDEADIVASMLRDEGNRSDLVIALMNLTVVLAAELVDGGLVTCIVMLFDERDVEVTVLDDVSDVAAAVLQNVGAVLGAVLLDKRCVQLIGLLDTRVVRVTILRDRGELGVAKLQDGGTVAQPILRDFTVGVLGRTVLTVGEEATA